MLRWEIRQAAWAYLLYGYVTLMTSSLFIMAIKNRAPRLVFIMLVFIVAAQAWLTWDMRSRWRNLVQREALWMQMFRRGQVR